MGDYTANPYREAQIETTLYIHGLKIVLGKNFKQK